MVVFGQKCLYSGDGCKRAKVVVFGQSGFILGKSGYIRAKWLYSGKSGCLRAKWLYSGKKSLYSGKMVVFG